MDLSDVDLVSKPQNGLNVLILSSSGRDRCMASFDIKIKWLGFCRIMLFIPRASRTNILLPRAFPQSLFGRLLILKCQDLTRVETERGFPLRTKACVVLSVSDVALIKFAHYPDIRLLFLPR